MSSFGLDLQSSHRPRPSWDQTWVSVARSIALRSLCSRDQVGAVIVSATNRIISTGYNGPPAGFDHEDVSCVAWCVRARAGRLIERPRLPDKQGIKLRVDYSDCPSLHAEANALSVCDRSVREGGKIYITSDVCFACAKLIANSGLAQVMLAGEDRDHAYRDPTKSYEFLDSCGVTVIVHAERTP